MNCVGYVRISSLDQLSNTSIANQKQKIEAYANAKGYTLKGVFEDTCSGATTKRDGLEKLRSRLEDGDINLVIVLKVDRIARSTIDGLTLIKEWHSKNISFISINENIETTTAIGESFLSLLLVFATLERQIIKERLVSGKNHKLQSGARVNGNLLGYRWLNGEFVVNEDEAKLVETAFKMASKGSSCAEIADHLNGLGATTKRNSRFSYHSIYRMLQNPIYAGQGMMYKGKLLPTTIKPIVSKYLWKKAISQK